MRASSRATAWILSAGVVASFVLLLAGLILSIAGADTSPAAIRPFTLSAQESSLAVIHLGVLILMATPLARVVSLSIEFHRKKERSFLLISLGVLFLLIISIYIGRITFR